MRIRALPVNQWLSEWNDVPVSPEEHRSPPLRNFYVCSIPALLLKRLAGIQRRSRDSFDAVSLGMQRQHDPERSEQIRKYVHGGYPFATLNSSDQMRFHDLLMPGWLPTSVIGNLLQASDERNGQHVNESDLVRVASDGSDVYLEIPEAAEAQGWVPSESAPIEIIDGQHRLWAFDDSDELDGTYEIPLVFFDGLDIGWQAYLFWTVNVTPKKISTSLAFDLYPLLRTQSWIDPEAVEGPTIYREARAQELTEILWRHPRSPWQGRIAMLGQREPGMVSQAAFIRSLLASFIKRASGQRVTIGGLLGAEMDGHLLLPWTRAQQAAFLIVLWLKVREHVTHTSAQWATAAQEQPNFQTDALFSGRNSLLATDQGVRAILQTTNDVLFLAGPELGLQRWYGAGSEEVPDDDTVSTVLSDFETKMQPAIDFIDALSEGLAKVDWRSSANPSLKDDERYRQASFRGSSGYRELRLYCLRTLRAEATRNIGEKASAVLNLVE